MSIKEILHQTRNIAIIGCSSNQNRTSFQIARYLKNSGFTIIPVNPNEESVLGEKSYPAMKNLPEDIVIDMVVIFRNKKFTEEMVGQIAEWSVHTGQKPVIWTQLNVSTAGARHLADKNELQYIENRCVMVEHRQQMDVNHP